MTAADSDTTTDAPSDPYLVVLDELIVTEPDDGFSREDVALAIVEMLSAARLLRTPNTPTAMTCNMKYQWPPDDPDPDEWCCLDAGHAGWCVTPAGWRFTVDDRGVAAPVGLHVDTERNPVGLTFTRDIGLPTDSDTAAPLPVDVIANELRHQSGSTLAGGFGARAEHIVQTLANYGYDMVLHTPTDSGTAARARALLDAATPGPWEARRSPMSLLWSIHGDKRGDLTRLVADMIHDQRDAELIAAAPTLITDLLAELDAWKEVADRTTVLVEGARAERDAAVAQRNEARAQMQSLTESFVAMEARAVTAERERDELKRRIEQARLATAAPDQSYDEEMADRGTDR